MLSRILLIATIGLLGKFAYAQSTPQVQPQNSINLVEWFKDRSVATDVLGSPPALPESNAAIPEIPREPFSMIGSDSGGSGSVSFESGSFESGSFQAGNSPSSAPSYSEASSPWQPADELQEETIPWRSRLRETLLQPNGEGAVSLSLDALFLATLKHSKRIEVAKLDSFIEQERVTQQAAQFDSNFFAQNLFTTTNVPTSTELEAGTGQQRLIQEDQNNTFGIRDRNLIGGNFEVGQTLRFLDSNSEFFAPNDQGLTRLVVRYNQPLLRDGGRLVNEGQILVARFNADAAGADAETSTIAILEELIEGYWTLYRHRGRYLVQRDLVIEIEELTKDLRKRTKIDAKRVLINQAEASLATQAAILATIRFELLQAQLQLVRTVGDRSLANYQELIPTSEPPDFALDANKDQALSVALVSRPEVRAAAQRIRSSELLRDISDRQLLPGLALILEATVSGLEGDYDIAQSFGNQFSQGGPGFVAGLSYDMPWGNRAARSRLRSSQLALAREIASLEDTVDQIRLEVAGSVTSLDGSREQFLIREQSAKLSADVVRSLLRRRQIFPSELDQISQLFVSEILDSLQRRTTAELELVNLTADFAIATLGLRKAMGILLTEEFLAAGGQ